MMVRAAVDRLAASDHRLAAGTVGHQLHPMIDAHGYDGEVPPGSMVRRFLETDRAPFPSISSQVFLRECLPEKGEFAPEGHGGGGRYSISIRATPFGHHRRV